MKIALDKNKPYGTISGKTENNARFCQGPYHFTADGTLIGDEAELIKEAQEKELQELQAELAAKQEAMAKAEAAVNEAEGVEVSDIDKPEQADEVVSPTVTGSNFSTPVPPVAPPVAPTLAPEG